MPARSNHKHQIKKYLLNSFKVSDNKSVSKQNYCLSFSSYALLTLSMGKTQGILGSQIDLNTAGSLQQCQRIELH
jgi:hypothetical protein